LQRQFQLYHILIAAKIAIREPRVDDFREVDFRQVRIVSENDCDIHP
jgi:hypothetical protein